MSAKQLARADLHVHTDCSDGADTPEACVAAAVAAAIAVLAITDHDRIDGARDAAAYAASEGLPIEVVTGSEITTRSGHLLGLYLVEPVPARLSLSDAIAPVREQGGLAVCAHPFVPHPGSAPLPLVLRLLRDGHGPDALEVHNPTPGARLVRPLVAAVADRYRVARVGGSDSHRAAEVGRATTRFPGRSAGELYGAIAGSATHSEGRDEGLAGILAIARRTSCRGAEEDAQMRTCGSSCEGQAGFSQPCGSPSS